MSRCETLPEVDRKASKAYAYYVSFVAAIGGFLFGYDLLMIAGAQIFVRKYFDLSAGQFGFATSSAILGCILGPTLGAYLCDKIGRKSVLVIAAVLFAVGAVWTALPNTIAVFNAFRILGGIGVGLASLASPLYIAEIAPPEIRGRLGLMYQLAITIGSVAATLVAWLLSSTLPDSISWRWMFASTIVPVFGFVVLLLTVPQSPRWLAGVGREKDAMAILTRIGGSDSAGREMEAIKASLEEETGSLRELLQPGIRMALLTGVLLAVFNQWTGWSGVAFYIPTLFQMAGYAKASDAIGASLVPLIANVFLTLVAVWLVDRVGRRPLWLITSAFMMVCLIGMGLMFHFGARGPVVVLMVLLIIAPHAIGLGCLPWLMMSEIYPTRIRARAVSVSTTFLWIAGFIGPLAFPKIVEISQHTIGSPAGVFWLYAAVCVASLVFGLRLLPETKGRNLEEIAASWEK